MWRGVVKCGGVELNVEGWSSMWRVELNVEGWG